MKTKLTVIFFVSLFVSLPYTSFAKTDIEFIVDVSGSMKKVSGQETQIASAVNALKQTLQTLPDEVTLALRVYGHREGQEDKAKSCRDSELVVPFAPSNKALIDQKTQNLTPKGYTPIAFSLEQARADFDATREAQKVIILLSDGEETCDGNPVAVLEKLKQDGFNVIVHTIGFNVDDKAKQQLINIAQASGGQYFDAQGAQALGVALGQATQASLVIEKDKSTYGQDIRGGNSYETAVPLESNTEYRLDHHQLKEYYDYFYVDLQASQEITVELKTLEKGVNLKDGQAIENNNPYAAIALHDSERNKLNSKNIIGDANRTEVITYCAARTGRYYLLLGSVYAAQHKDHVTFKLKTTFKGDLGSQSDAGADMKTALRLAPGRYDTNYLGGSDEVDYFVFDVQAGDKYYVGIIPGDEFSNCSFNVAILDEFKQKKLEQSSRFGEGLKTPPITFVEGGTHYLSVGLRGTLSKTGTYTLVLEKI